VSEPLPSAGPRAAAEAALMRTRQADKYSCEQQPLLRGVGILPRTSACMHKDALRV